ncbi:hypothetical protein SEA_GHOBES_5 [Gordonia phage Ghobes]|uniref:Uncharacterized protein n=1 Tax=Gordonia phage Ghobes TaxID=1887647 RepID=A0A1B3B042_9CAUD|nr:hypothetical protein KCH37_gp05 [Gordonia phage Ghobes]AOE44359.1 hypothetical protein SEA_GHOBES_5 [Gordonia phage Ghobes]
MAAALKVYEYGRKDSNHRVTAQLSAEDVERFEKAGLEVKEVKEAKAPANKAAGSQASK